jgi:antitoxin component YwqK of YwqJK toxin-antitoxin module
VVAGASARVRLAVCAVTATCRAGQVHGNYQLIDRGQQLRATGAFQNGKRTGTFIFWNQAGSRIAVVPYDADRKTGTVALWYPAARKDASSVHELEAPYVRDALHGVVRSWHSSGRRRAEYRYEHGMLAEAQAWDERGRAFDEREARTLAKRDEATFGKRYAALEALVASHLPACD